MPPRIVTAHARTGRASRIRRRRGFGLVEIGAALLIMALLAVPFTRLGLEYHQDAIDSVAAGQLARVTRAAREMVEADLPGYAARAKGGRVSIPFADLTSGGFLPATDTGITPYGQSYRIALAAPDSAHPERLELVVLTETGSTGRAIEPTRTPAIAVQAGDRGGYVNEANQLTGSLGGWRVADTQARYGLQARPGTVGTMTPIGSDAITSTFLNRSPTGDPEANRMHAAIDMTGNNIDNAGKIDAQTGHVRGDLTVDGRIVGHGDLETDGQGYFNKDVQVRGQIRAGSAQIDGNAAVNGNLQAGTIKSTAGIEAGGNIGAQDITANGLLRGKELEPTQIVTVGALCNFTGRMARLGDGAAASCVNGQWTKLGDGKSCPGALGDRGDTSTNTSPHGSIYAWNSRNKHDDYFLKLCWDGTWHKVFVGRG